MTETSHCLGLGHAALFFGGLKEGRGLSLGHGHGLGLGLGALL